MSQPITHSRYYVSQSQKWVTMPPDKQPITNGWDPAYTHTHTYTVMCVCVCVCFEQKVSPVPVGPIFGWLWYPSSPCAFEPGWVTAGSLCPFCRVCDIPVVSGVSCCLGFLKTHALWFWTRSFFMSDVYACWVLIRQSLIRPNRQSHCQINLFCMKLVLCVFLCVSVCVCVWKREIT